MGLIQGFKNILKTVLPPPIKVFNREIESILLHIKKSEAETKKKIDTYNTVFDSIHTSVSKILESQQRFDVVDKQLEALLVKQQRFDAIDKQLEALLVKQQRFDAVDKQLEALLEKQERFEEEGTTLLENKTKYVIETLNANLQTTTTFVDEKTKAIINKVDTHEQSYSNTLNEKTQSVLNRIAESEKTVQNKVVEAKRSADEATWAAIFNNTITDSTWLHNKTFSAGRWAMGYPALYVIYRILNEVKPKRILELGLGQSTRLIGQYAAANKDVEHFVVEHDSNWIDFFTNDFKLTENTNVVHLDREMVSYKDAEVRVYKGFTEVFKDKQFDFICIDAPLGGDMKQFARIDTLRMLPNCLSKSFIVALDDCNRPGETATLKEMHNVLTDSNIQFSSSMYDGNKDFAVLCSNDFKFVCTM